MQRKMGERSGDAAQDRKREESSVPDASGDGAAEGRHPEDIDEEMDPPAMDDHVGDEGGYRRKITPGQFRRSAAVARRDEGEREQKLNAEVVGEKASDDLYDDHDRGGQEHAARQIQHRL